MTGIKLAGTFLIAGMLFTGQVWADGNPDTGSGGTVPGISSGWNVMSVRPEAPFMVVADAAVVPQKAAAFKPEAVPNAETAPKAAVSNAEATQVAEAVQDAELVTGTEATEDAEIASEEVIQETTIADPIEPWNRWMFQFNDKLYFYGLKPVAQGYNAVVPEPMRVSVNNFFKNVAMPVRFINSLLQLKFKAAGTELARFGINTTIGLVGFLDVAKNDFDIYEQNEDMGQTLGTYGMPGMMYIVWPFIGPSTVRDTIGLAGDSFLDVANYIDPFYIPMSLHAYDLINKTSLDLTSYEDLKKSSIEPYTAVRDAYIQYRNGLIEK